MKMKKLITIGIAAATLLTACKSELIENSPENAIEFNAFLNNITRSDISGNGTEFAVYGITKDKEGQVESLFDRRQISGNGTSWSYTPIEFWTKDNAYRFSAFHPFEGNWLLEDWSDSEEKSRGILYFNNEKAAGQEDLLMAIMDRDPVKEPSIEPTVDFNFNHQLSRIYFRFENGYPENAAYSLKISDIRLYDVISDGTMDITSETAVWSTGDDRTEFALTLENEKILHPSTRETVRTHSRFIIPSELPMTVEFSVSLYLNDGKDKVTTYRHRIELPRIEMKKGFSYDLKAVIDEYNTNPEDSNAPLKFIVNEIEQWEETPETGEGQI